MSLVDDIQLEMEESCDDEVVHPKNKEKRDSSSVNSWILLISIEYEKKLERKEETESTCV